MRRSSHFSSSSSSFAAMSTSLVLKCGDSISHSRGRVGEQRCLALLSAANSLPKLAQTHAHILKSGLLSNLLVLTKLCSTSAPLDASLYALTIFLSSPASVHPDTFLINSLLHSLSLSSSLPHHPHLVLLPLSLLLRLSLSPNQFTFPFSLKAAASLRNLRLPSLLHASLLKFGFSSHSHSLNSLIHAYSSCGPSGLPPARQVFDEMPLPDSVSWSAVIAAHARCHRPQDAVSLFRSMLSSGSSPDDVTLLAVLPACADLGALHLGSWVALYIDRQCMPKTVPLCNALIDMYAKCGSIDDAGRVFCAMPERSIVSWTAMIDGLAMHGRSADAVGLFEEMVASGMAPDGVAFIGVLSACSHAGLVEKGCRYFELMERKFHIVPKIEHYGCMVDLYGRAGLLKHAVEFVRDMPMEPNPVIWRMLVSACRLHREVELGEWITKRLIGDEPMHSSNYVLLSNVYATMQRWESKTRIRSVMDKKGIKKMPGCSLIELNNEIYEFVAGDKSHPQYKEIYEMVDEMGRETRAAGYVPATSEVLLDIDEEDKEDTLNRHGEKLAIAFALLNTKPGTLIRIVKNLRVCSDCHSATKFISKVYNREIIVRDRNRFHLFKDGICSCGDFW